MKGIFLLLGSNLGERLENLRQAVQLLVAEGIKTLDESSIYETAPWGDVATPWFLNLVVEVETYLDVDHLLESIWSIENKMGRVRNEKWGDRLIDIDILYYHNQIIDTDTLVVPHPGIPDRRFTLMPLMEMQPFALHPLLHKTHAELLAACTDSLDCACTDLTL